MDVSWYKCKGSIWCELGRLDLENKNVSDVVGVYILWAQNGDERVIIKIGQGRIADELKKNMKELAIMAFMVHGLFVTWAEISPSKIKKVYSWLIHELKPKIIDEKPSAPPINCNLPWE
jgi:hypothetical protein